MRVQYFWNYALQEASKHDLLSMSASRKAVFN